MAQKTKGLPSGSVYLRGSIYWLKYYVPGKAKPIRISSGTSDEQAAITLLRQKMARTVTAIPRTMDPDRVGIGQLLDLLIEDYRYEERATTYDVEMRIEKHLRPAFGHVAAKDLGTVQLKNYVMLRKKEGAEQATINKELAFLRRSFRLGSWHEPPLVLRVPRFPIKAVDNAREGILSYPQYQAIRDMLPSYARIALVIAFHTGARKGEIRKIRLDRVNFEEGRIELARKTTKGTTERRSARYLPIYGEMRGELELAIEQCDKTCGWLIQRNGQPVADFEKTWRAARKEAKVPHALFHDLRRTAVTNMIEAGFSEKEAMEISGHKTRSIFDRYHIVSPERTKALGERLEAHMSQKRLKSVPGSVPGKPVQGSTQRLQVIDKVG